VVLRGTMPETFYISGKEFVPLKCMTAKYCITSNIFKKGDCEEFGGEDYTTVRVGNDKGKMKEQIKKFISQEIADCWAMMGEAKIQIFTRRDEDAVQCAICARIAFSKEVKKELGVDENQGIKPGDLKIRGLGKYMISHNIPNTKTTYWEFVTNGLGDKGYQVSTDYFTLDEKAIVFRELGRGVIGKLAGTVGGALSGMIALGTIGSVVPVVGNIIGGAAGLIGGGIIGGYYGGKAGDEFQRYLSDNFKDEEGEGNYISSFMFTDYNAENLKKPLEDSGLGCKSFYEIP